MKTETIIPVKTRNKAIFIIGILFFIFGFVTWINSVLIPYFKLACDLNTKQAMLVAFAFYISYFIMAIPASFFLKKTGFKNGMVLGLMIIAAGALLFIPAAITRTYELFLLGLFVQATGLTILQTASNPYITIMGPIESAAKRISIMGICNKIAGAIAPLVLIHSLTKNPDEIDQLQMQLPGLSLQEQTVILNELSSRLIVPYIIIALVLVGLGLMIRMTRLPDVKPDEDEFSGNKFNNNKTTVFQFPYLVLGAITIFCSTSVEVLVVDSIINYGQYMGFSFREAKFFASYTLLIMVISYLIGIVAIPKFIEQKRVLQWSAITGFLFCLLAILISGKASVWLICLLGLSNALLWPSIWPLSINGLGKFTEKGSALMIMGIIGGAVTPLLYGYISDKIDPQQAYWVMIPCYAFILFFAMKGHKIGKMISSKTDKNSLLKRATLYKTP
ncbi:sugar MFS transporter [Agriterribacter humi]|jgi:glucose/galactose transporter|uniref:sugar MFS transporter n=1 Tax=Agriterribacter humi TaxID=1104781 RepID=UPI0012643EB4|nr:sugar MFS transporter [Agriterribacter humi]